MSEIQYGEQELKLLSIRENFQKTIKDITNGFEEYMEVDTIDSTQKEVDSICNLILESSKRDLTNQEIEEITKESNEATKRIKELIEKKQKPMDMQEISLMLLKISRKLDLITYEQAEEKKRLEAIEKALQEEDLGPVSLNKIPLIPQDKLQEILDQVVDIYKEKMQLVKTYDTKYLKDLWESAQWREPDMVIKNTDQSAIFRDMNIIVENEGREYFESFFDRYLKCLCLKMAKDENMQARDDMDWEELHTFFFEVSFQSIDDHGPMDTREITNLIESYNPKSYIPLKIREARAMGVGRLSEERRV